MDQMPQLERKVSPVRPHALEPQERGGTWHKIKDYLMQRAAKHQSILNSGREDRREEERARGALKEILNIIKELEGESKAPTLPPGGSDE